MASQISFFTYNYVGNWKYNMQIYTALLVFNRSKIVFTTFLSIQILEQFYHIHKLCYTLFPDFLFYFAFSPQAHYTTFQKDTYQVLFLRKTIQRILTKKEEKIQTRKQHRWLQKSLSSSFKKNVVLKKLRRRRYGSLPFFQKHNEFCQIAMVQVP